MRNVLLCQTRTHAKDVPVQKSVANGKSVALSLGHESDPVPLLRVLVSHPHDTDALLSRGLERRND